MQKQKKLAAQLEQEQLRDDYLFLKKAVTKEGFFKLYFETLPKHSTYIETFNSLNDRYFNIVGEYRYSTYDAFRMKLNRNHN